MQGHITTEHKVAYLKQKLDDPDTPSKDRLEILGLFMSYYTNEEFDIKDFLRELDRLAGTI